MFTRKSPTPSQDEKGEERREEGAEAIPSAVNFVTKNTFRSQSSSPVTQATVEDLWRRALKQEADFRTRYWAMIAGVVIVSVVAILAVVAPLAAQRDTFKEFENRMQNVERKSESNINSPVLSARRAPTSHREYLYAKHSPAQDCSNVEPISPNSLGPMWACVARDWEQWEASNGTLLTYLCSKSATCSVMLTGQCSVKQWIYMTMEVDANCECKRGTPITSVWSNKRRKRRNTSLRKKRTGKRIEFAKDVNWRLTHCKSDPPSSWGCAVSDWNSSRNNLGYNPRAKGYLVNYACRSQTRGCAVARTLVCGQNGIWKVVFTSSIVNDCICDDQFLHPEE